MTTYTEKQLRREAAIAVKSEAKAAKCRARTIGYSLIIGDCVTLVAHGQRTDNGYRFDINIAI